MAYTNNSFSAFDVALILRLVLAYDDSDFSFDWGSSFMALDSIYGRMSAALLAIVALQVPVAAWQSQWYEAWLSFGIVAGILIGLKVTQRLSIYTPEGLQFMMILLAFAWLYLGYVRGYFDSFAWWDSLLHLYASATVGVFAFILIHLLNRCSEFGACTRPGLMALFVFVFAVAIGAFWEIFEFGVDQVLGAQMQKPAFGDSTGLTDTISDLAVDTIGGLSVSAYGYYHLKKGNRPSVLKNWINAFISGNPRLFGHA